MITVSHIWRARLRGSLNSGLRGSSTHMVRVVVTGRKDLALVADGAAKDPVLADHIRVAKRFTMTMPAEKWAEMKEGMRT